MHKQEISGSRSLDQIIWHADGNAETRTRVDSLINQLFSYFQGAHAADCYWPAAGNLVCELMSAPAASESTSKITRYVIFDDLAEAGSGLRCGGIDGRIRP